MNNDKINNNNQEKNQTFIDWVRNTLKELLDISQDTDKKETIEAVIKEIPFRGHNAWILIFSVLVASLGLNISSTAVVIGAMLISPLLGPIVGVGLSAAINDIDMLKKSIVNFGIMILLSILTAYIYFLISPLTKLTPELAARTYPTFLDVLVAFFGGLALIVAKTKRGTLPSVIYGVAIATALMPPLCTAGYGLAVWNLEYFGGAFYLFTINSIFIALASFIVAKLLRFPLVKHANSKRRKRISQIVTIVSIVVMIPSALLFWNLLQKEVFISSVDNFIRETVVYPDTYIVKHDYDYNRKYLNVYLGGETVPKNIISMWQTKLSENEALSNATLNVLQAKDEIDFSPSNFATLTELYSDNLERLHQKENQIHSLKNQIHKLSLGMSIDTLFRELKINYTNLESITFSQRFVSNFEKIDTIPQFTIKWKNGTKESEKNASNPKIKEWIFFKMKKDSVDIKFE